MKEFEVVYEAFDFFFTKQMQRQYDYVRAPDIEQAKRIARFKLGQVDIISVEEFV